MRADDYIPPVITKAEAAVLLRHYGLIVQGTTVVRKENAAPTEAPPMDGRPLHFPDLVRVPRC